MWLSSKEPGRCVCVCVGGGAINWPPSSRTVDVHSRLLPLNPPLHPSPPLSSKPTTPSIHQPRKPSPFQLTSYPPPPTPSLRRHAPSQLTRPPSRDCGVIRPLADPKGENGGSARGVIRTPHLAARQRHVAGLPAFNSGVNADDASSGQPVRGPRRPEGQSPQRWQI